ncbi:beta-phosphoglucomutase family hydrolase [Actinocorallia longicatena]|uniref:Beta-phosphoglucomutase n=2 Tax=Actinocorallia longicatena TaxID=111803 RepID=A0ABP6QGH6_9ACTN
MLGLPDGVRACLFDLDGVLTDTAAVHASAWKRMFDEFLAGRGLPPFDLAKDYSEYVDGKKREDGTRSFLASRGITLPEGSPDDPPSGDSVWGLSARKNDLVQQLIEKDGVKVFPGSVRYLEAVREAGLRTAVVSSSANTVQVLAATGLTGLFDARVDGVTARERNLPGKPAPDMFLAGAEAVSETAATSVVFEDALAGVAAGHAGHFALVVGVDRLRDGVHGPALSANGATTVVTDLSDLLDTP